MALMASAGTSIFPVTLPSPHSGAKGSEFRGGRKSLGGLKSKHVSFGCLQVKASAQAPSKVNGTVVTTTVQEGFVSRQKFSIKSYEIDADRKMSMLTLMNYLQESLIHHVNTNVFHCDDFASTPEMSKKDLIWVTIRMKVVTYRYPTWGDDIQVETRISPSGNIAMRTNCLLSDCKTGEILIGASSVCVMMNKLTRKLSKIPEEVRKEMEAYSANSALILEEDNNQLPKLDDNSADYISTSFSPKWSDLDVNQHVNNVKYIDWILESVPVSIMESHELSSMTLEYRRECGKNDKLQSLIAVSGPVEVANLRHGGHVECNHLLRLEDGAEIMRGRTEWRPKLVNKFDIMHKVL